MTAPSMRRALLETRGLEIQFDTRRGIARAVNELDLTLYEGERFGLVGESGSGKTTTLLGLLRLIEEPGRIAAGEILLDGVDLLKLSDEAMRRVRLSRIAMVPQGAMNSLNPVIRIGDQMRLTILEHERDVKRDEADDRIRELLEMVGLLPTVARLYPHELSGGMKQRVCIATAICLGPQLILADEPTSALDVVVQRQIMQTLRSLQERIKATVLLVGHDMGLMAQFVERIGIMYGGKLVEVGTVEEIFRNPRHPYTQLLISSIPSFETRGTFKSIPGAGLSLLNPPGGCLFHPRCPDVMDECATRAPTLVQLQEDSHRAACLLYEKGNHAGTT
jgi:peptide/nickel transport system ATP-binding protein